MPDGRRKSVLDATAVLPLAVGSGSGPKPCCDFAAALLRELTIDPPPAAAYADARFEALPEDEEAVIVRALAGETQAGGFGRKAGLVRWFGGGADRLGDVVKRGLRVMTVIAAPICSMLLNTDVLAIARRLWADLALRDGTGAAHRI